MTETSHSHTHPNGQTQHTHERGKEPHVHGKGDGYMGWWRVSNEGGIEFVRAESQPTETEAS